MPNSAIIFALALLFGSIAVAANAPQTAAPQSACCGSPIPPPCTPSNPCEQ